MCKVINIGYLHYGYANSVTYEYGNAARIRFK